MWFRKRIKINTAFRLNFYLITDKKEHEFWWTSPILHDFIKDWKVQKEKLM